MTVDDPFSDILRLANAQSVVSGGFTAGGSWAIRFPAFDKLKFSALIRGSCWLMVDGDQEPVRVEAGDVFLLSAHRSFVLASDLGAVPVEAASVFSPNVSEIRALAVARSAFRSAALYGWIRRVEGFSPMSCRH